MSKQPQPTRGERIAEQITNWSGTMAFLLANAAIFAVWIAANTLLPWRFDAYPFQFLTLSVSLEAIFLSVLVLITQNRQGAYDRRLNERDAAVNREARRTIQEIQDDIAAIKEVLIP